MYCNINESYSHVKTIYYTNHFFVVGIGISRARSQGLLKIVLGFIDAADNSVGNQFPLEE